MKRTEQRPTAGIIILFSVLSFFCFFISAGIREYWKLELCSSASVTMMLLIIALFLTFAGLTIFFLYHIFAMIRRKTWIKWVWLVFLIGQGIGIMISVLEMIYVFIKQ